jgi:hypothetical protein
MMALKTLEMGLTRRMSARTTLVSGDALCFMLFAIPDFHAKVSTADIIAVPVRKTPCGGKGT